MGDMADFIEDMCDISYYPRPRTKMCRYCKKRGLVWILQKAGWRLSENGRTRHKCPDFHVVRLTPKKSEQ